jgi:hypothetical protein
LLVSRRELRKWLLKPEMSPVHWKNFSIKPNEYLLYISNPMKFVSLIAVFMPKLAL